MLRGRGGARFRGRWINQLQPYKGNFLTRFLMACDAALPPHRFCSYFAKTWVYNLDFGNKFIFCSESYPQFILDFFSIDKKMQNDLDNAPVTSLFVFGISLKTAKQKRDVIRGLWILSNNQDHLMYVLRYKQLINAKVELGHSTKSLILQHQNDCKYCFWLYIPKHIFLSRFSIQ